MSALPPPQGTPDPRMKPPGYDRIRDNAPWWQGCILVVLAAVTAATASTGVIAAVTLAFVPVLALSAQLIGRWAARMQAWAVGAVWVGAVVTVWRYPVHAPHLGPGLLRWLLPLAASPPVLTLISLTSYCFLFGWERTGIRWHRSRLWTNRVLDRQAKWHMAEGFSRFAIETGLNRYTAADRGLARMARGARWLIRTGPLNTDQLKRFAHAVAGWFEMDPATVDAVATSNAAVTAVDFNTVDTLARMPEWVPNPANDITEIISLGLDYNRAPLGFKVGDQHVAVVGTTGAGKSMTMRLGMISYAAALNGDLWIIDPVKSGEDYTPLEPHARVFADNVPAAVAALRQLLVISRQRAAWKKANNVEVFTPTADMPRIGVFIDEAVSLMAQGKEVVDLFVLLITTCRSSGINLWFGVQRPEGRIFDTNVRAQITAWYVMAVDSPATTRLALPSFPQIACHLYVPYQPDSHVGGGYGALHYPGLGYPREGRTWHINRATFARYCLTLAPPAPATYGLELVEKAQQQWDRESTNIGSTGPSPQVGGQALDLTGLDRLIVRMLAETDEPVRQVDIVSKVPYSKQAVSQRVKKLAEEGVVVVDKGRISLPVEVTS